MQQHQHGEPLLVEALGEYSADSHVCKRFRPAGKCCRRLCADAQTTAVNPLQSAQRRGQDCVDKDKTNILIWIAKTRIKLRVAKTDKDSNKN